MARIRTIEFLPEIFQTPTNVEFFAATLDQIVNSPSTTRIQGYIGSKLGYGVNAKDYYVTEPSKTRTDYQLDPGVVFTKTNESVAQDFISYPGMIDALKLQGGITANNSDLFKSQFYSWDSFCNLDKLINFNEYYWLPVGPPAVTVGAATVYSNEDYRVTSLQNTYDITPIGSDTTSLNPTLTLLRGGIYTFAVQQETNFWIQSAPGVSGYLPNQPNIPTRDVFGVTNNGASNGVVTFVVPQKDAQDQYNFPGNNPVDVVSTIPFDQVNGALLSELGGIDGVTSLDGLTVMFYNTGIPDEIGYIGTYFGETDYDTNSDTIVAPLTLVISSSSTTAFTLATGNTTMLEVDQSVTFDNPVFGGITAGNIYYVTEIVNSTDFKISDSIGGTSLTLTSGSGAMTVNINQGLFQEGFYTTVSDNFYTISYIGDPTDPVLRLLPTSSIPNNQKIVPQYGSQWVNRGFYRTSSGIVNLIPQITAPLDTLYYQDSQSPNKVGSIKLIDNNLTNTIDVELDILGRATYTSPNGVEFTNGLKVTFTGDVVPSSYLQGEYYVEGVGTAIELINTTSLVCPEGFTLGSYNPWDITAWDIGNFDSDLFVPVDADYITIARNSISRNAWSRSNRWFHIDVINATATYNNNSNIVTEFATVANKAKRPIIEFYPNLKLFNSGSLGKKAIDFYDTRATDALSSIAGSRAYYPDVETFTSYTATINPVTAGTSTTITVDAENVTGVFQVGMYVADTQAVLPVNSQITDISGTTTLTITVEWEDAHTIVSTPDSSIVGTDTTVDNYALFPGARIVFSTDTDVNVRDRIFVANIVKLTPTSDPVITLEYAEDSLVQADEQLAILRGFNYQGLSFYFDGVDWISGQQKTTVNQPPLFDILDANGVSFGNNEVYASSSFIGNKIFSYGIGVGFDDPILGFPIRYSSIDNVGDISFDVSLNLDTFDYVSDSSPITQKVNTGYVYNYLTRTTYERELGWQTAIAESQQYQAFSFDFDPAVSTTASFECDIAALPNLDIDEVGWPRVQVYQNNVYLEPSDYTVTRGSNSTTIELTDAPSIATVIQVLLLSDQVSKIGYYTIPINLNNNPLNADLTSVNVGDIRAQYRDIFINAPNTTGQIFGANNFRDCGNLVPYGTKIIQNSASLVLPGTFLRKQDHNLFDALLFNSREYAKFKQLLIDTVQNTDFTQRYLPSEILDMALDQITASKSQSNAFFWSDMLPSKAPFRSNTYTFANDLDTSIYPLAQVYDFESANYNGVLVYRTQTVNNNPVQKQLTRGVDYTVSTDSASLTVTLDLDAGDRITIKEYNQTYGSYVPNTPTKLGMYHSFEPAVILDSDYTQPTYFIKGHDGSYSKLFGSYDPNTGILSDLRDKAILEFELRIYNNLKLSEEVPIKRYEIVPGFFRTPTYTWDEWIQMYSTTFLDWIGQNRLDYKTQFYNVANEFTYNYVDAGNKLDGSPIKQGYWRGVYEYFYDSASPNTNPWEMLDFANKPTWWETRYGPAPYTSDNGILWGDLEEGLIWNNGDSFIVPELARPGLSNIIPVDSNGDLVSPLVALVGNYNPSIFQRDWVVGDDASVELSYRRSSSYPFDLMRIFALTRPAEFFNLGVDIDNYKYNEEFNQYLVDNRSHLNIGNVEIYGDGTAKTSYINWIVDFEKQQGVDATANITTLLDNLDVRLVYRLAGYSDKDLMNFYVEKGSPNSRNASLLIPDESYSLLLYDNQPYARVRFSGVIVQQVPGGWTVYGNSQNYAYFTTLAPKSTSSFTNLTVENLTVRISDNYYDTEVVVPYGTQFFNVQDLSQFLASYNAYLTANGMVFDEIVSGLEFNWNLMIEEFLYWVQTGWSDGSVITLNPAATVLKVDKESQIVQPLLIEQHNFILNQDSYPISLNNLSIQRDGTKFTAKTLNQGDSMSYSQFNLSNFEHGIVFDNITLFNDVIYNLTTGLRQNRINVRGTKTAEWNGTMNAYGFILNQDNVVEWSKEVKYTKGEIVKYKNKYWAALQIIEPSTIFDETKWKIVDYNNIQKGLLPNASTRAYESTLYYDINKANLEQDADLLAFSLIGYRPRDYLALVDLTDITQINVYQNMIKNKGTRNATLAFKGANLPQGGIDYDLFENWAIKSGEYGGVLNENFVEFRINQNYMTGNPSVVSLTNGEPTVGSMQEIPLYSLFNYGTSITTPNILSTLDTVPVSSLYPNAGYVNFNDVKMASYYYSGLPSAVDASGTIVPINDFYVRDYMWMANFKDKWGTFTFKSLGPISNVSSNLNGTATVTFVNVHSLSKYDPLAIIHFAAGVDGYYIVSEVVNNNQVIINLTIPNGTSTINGQGIGLAFQKQRVDSPADINSLDLMEAEFTKNTVWVDENSDGEWAVYRKSINYQNATSLTEENSTSYGSSVAYQPFIGYLVGDAGAGKVYRYTLNTTTNETTLVQTITQGTSFGSKIVYYDNIAIISEPTSGTPKVYIYALNDTVLTDQMITYQTAIAAPGGVTDWGSDIAVSTDGNWIYISDTEHNKVYVYRKNNIELTGGYFTSGQTYVINSVGTTDFTSIGAVQNLEGIVFVATGAGSGTGVATQITYEQSAIIDGSLAGTVSGDNFGFALSTNYNGDTVVVGAPNTVYQNDLDNFGIAYIYQRTHQNVEVEFNSPSSVQTLQLAWTPDATTGITGSRIDSNYIHCSTDMTVFAVNDPVMFTGTVFGDTGLEANMVYYIHTIGGGGFGTANQNIKVKTSRSSSTAVTFANETGLSFSVNVQTTPLYVAVNGTQVTDNNYAAVGSSLIYTGSLLAGDIVTIDDSEFSLVQRLQTNDVSRANIYYGYALDTNVYGSELLIGSPFEIDSENREGIVYRYTNGGSKYGVIIGEDECNVLGNTQILLNGYLIYLTPGDAEHVAAIINAARVTNIEASATSDNTLIIQLVDSDIANVNEKLTLSVFNTNVLSELGITLFTETQVINCPHSTGASQFGKTIKFNEYGSVVIASPACTRFEGTTFDFTDDENLDNDTVFDNNATRFVDSYPNAGAVYMFDYLSQYNENLLDAGQFVFAQGVNSTSTNFGSQPMYGASVDFNGYSVIVGSPDYLPIEANGQAVIFTNSVGVKDWAVFRQSAPIVDISKIQNSQIFSAETNNTLINLDYMDPLQNKLLGAARENIDYVSSTDPARYNSGTTSINGNIWGAERVGQIWLNTSGIRWINYHQDDVVYNSKYWGTVFPGSDVAVFTWVASNVPPSQYTGPGTAYNVNSYTISSVLNASNVVTPIYYFWARNTAIVNKKLGKTLSDSVVATYIARPQASGIAYMAPVLPNTFALYNSFEYINANDSVFHIGYANGTTDDVVHNEYTLIRENFADDFLPGLPISPVAQHTLPEYGGYPTTSTEAPTSLYARMLDSLAGADQAGGVVPNPYLPKAVQSGVLVRPRQSFFYNRFNAVKNYLLFANDVMDLYPIAEIRPNASFLFTSDEFYDTQDYWEYVNWWAEGYDNSTKSSIQVAIYADLSTLSVPINTLVTVEQNGAGLFEVYRFDGDGVWTRIGLQNGTINFKSSLWDYATAKLGFGGDFFDTNPFDLYPSEETRQIVRALNEQIYVGDLLIYRNESLILLFSYIQSETSESQNFLPWLNKTSLVDVEHTIRELLPFEVFKSDNQDFLAGYINEVKPYHVVIKEFVFKYTGEEVYDGNFTDFDLPATYNANFEKFISPQLVYNSSSNEYEYDLSDDIWATAPYNQWFANFGTSIGIPINQDGELVYVGQLDYQITTLNSYLNLGTDYVLVDNAQGFPTTGTIRMGEEYITYAYVDRALNLLGGLARGVDGSTVSDHIPGENIYIDLPPVIVLDGGSGYSEPPRVTAWIDTSIYPEPKTPAVLQAVMSLDSVLSIRVIDPGAGYVVQPEIRIEPSAVMYFSNLDVNSVLHTIKIYAPDLATGNLIQFKAGSNGVALGNVVDNQWYYVNVLETTPVAIVALYTTYRDALNDDNRVQIFDDGTSIDMSLSAGAKASAIVSATPIRENNISIKFDRTTYTSQVVDWEAGAFYGSFFAGNYNNSETTSSSSITLENTNPDISSILASAQGVVFEIVDAENDQVSTWSSFVRYIGSTSATNNSIRLIPQDGNNDPLNPEPNASGTTIGFYVNMPIKFVGAVVGGLVDGTTYYVREILSDLDFTISATVDGAEFTLTTATVSDQTLSCYVGEVTNTAVLTINYPGILTVTATELTTNILTVPMSAIGTGGTEGFYTNLPVFFIDPVFGGIVANQTYYVTTVIDKEHFTISETQDPIIATVSETISSSDYVVVDSTTGFATNNVIIFTEMLDGSGNELTSFGGITSGAVYYVSEIIDATHLTISNKINGAVLSLSNQTGSASMTNQKNTVALTTVTGEMTMNVSLPVSPGQVDGQLVTFYNTSTQYPDISNGTIGTLIERTINATIGDGSPSGVNRIAIKAIEGGTDFFYANLPLRVNTNIDALTTGTTYYVIEYSGMEDPMNPGEFFTNIEVSITSSTSSGNWFNCDTTESLYVNMPIIFSGGSIGGVVIGQEYYVKTINNGTQFSVTDILGGSTLTLTTENGVMVGTGDPWITVSTTSGGAVVNLTTNNSGSSFTQFITGVPTFDLSYILGGYRAIISNGGEGFATNNTIVIAGTEIGGTSPTNDATLTVNTVDEDGAITSVICSGTVPDTSTQYYIKVISANQVELYSNPLLTVPVSGIDLPYVGFTTANVTGVNSGTDALTIADTSIFEENDAVVFTGDTDEAVTNLVAGNTYYILDILSGTTFTVSTLPGDASTKVNIITTISVDFTIAKAGSFAILPEPFYFNQSIVRFNNRVYVCIVSNNDSDFVFGKWELLNSGDRRLNALDRTVGYYQPTVNMPGLDLTQLFDGITYPNPTYRGNAFQPDEQFPIDTILQDQPFYPSAVQLTSVLWNGTRYIATANFSDYTGTINSILGDSWDVSKVTSSNVSATDIAYGNGYYVMTTDDEAVPALVSTDAIIWSAATISPVELNSVVYYNGTWVAVGTNIYNSTTPTLWARSTTFDEALDYVFYGVSQATLPAFTGFVAVGKGKRYDYTTGIALLVDTNLIQYSADGVTWTEVPTITPKGLYAVAQDSTIALAVGESGVIYYTQNGANWLGLNEVTVISVNGSNNQLNLTNTAGFAVNDTVRFTKSFSTITAGTTYYIKTVVSPTQVTLSATMGGATYTLAAGVILNQTMMYAYDAADPSPSSLRDIIYANSIWVAVGDDGVIKTSPDAITWTTQTSGTTEDLNGITYNSTSGVFTVVGENNVILASVDNGVTWTETALFIVSPTLYDVVGNEFQYGYGPEELIPGNVTDNLSMRVTTSPGTTWPVVEYGHTGFNVRTVELSPTSGTQTEYSFANIVENVAQIYVQVLDASTQLGTTLPQSEYTVDWVNKTITLNTPIQFSPSMQFLRIDVYEVGNGDQIVKASTDYRPFRLDSVTGFNQIYLNCNYSAPSYQGSGVIRPGTTSVTVKATVTESGTNRIYCDSVSDFVLNGVISFEGAVFGNIQEDTAYYVKTISYATNSITVSDSYIISTGTAGPTFILADATGEMYVNIQVGSPTVWTSPIVFHNGTQLVLGTTGLVTRTKASNNALTTTATSGIIVGTPIVFSNTMFGTVIQPMTVYYVDSIVDNNEFTISATQGGPTLTLTNATGGATFITSDYSFAVQANGTSAKMIFPKDTYDSDVDYIVYSVFGETEPQQYGFTVPMVEEFDGNGSTSQFTLSNYVSGANPENAIVEINGVRQTISQYEINPSDNTITFGSPPPNNSVVSVLSYNQTGRQYFTSQYGITGNPGSSLVTLTVGSTSSSLGSYDQNTPVVQLWDEDTPNTVVWDQELYWLTLTVGDTSSLNVNDSIIFQAPTIGGIVAGQTYYIIQIINSTDFVISETVGGEAFQVTTDSGSMDATANGLTVADISTISNTIDPALATAVATASTVGAPNRITVDTTFNFIVGQTVQFFGTSFDANINTDGTVYFVASVVDGTHFTIKDYAGTTIVTAGGTGSMKVVVGGQPAIRVTTAIVNNFVENTLVRIDGTTGSLQLNNNLYYAKIISPYTFDLYNTAYDPAEDAVNDPVTTISAYTGGGFVWRDGLFFIISTYTSASSASTDEFTVASTSDLVEGTPVYFSKIETAFGSTLLGGVIQGTKYFIKEITSATTFTISDTYQGDVRALTSGTDKINVTQWSQDNVDRIWVTLNGLRVPSSKLRINEANEVSILTRIVSGDEVIITSMIPTATPNQDSYMNLVNSIGEPTIYNISSPNTTWLTQPMYDLSTEVFVDDVSRLTKTIIQDETAPAEDNGYFYIGLTADKNSISGITVFNNTTNAEISSSSYEIVLIDLSPILKITAGAYITAGDSLTVTTLEGNIVYINGEQIKFGSVDFTNNALGNIQRGVNGTSKQPVIAQYTTVYGLLASNRMSDVYYDQTWNSYNWNAELGDPLSISDTVPAEFLNKGVS